MLVVGFGVLEMLDRGTRLGGQQRLQAVAGNVAQTELERIRALPVANRSNLRDDSEQHDRRRDVLDLLARGLGQRRQRRRELHGRRTSTPTT